MGLPRKLTWTFGQSGPIPTGATWETCVFSCFSSFFDCLECVCLRCWTWMPLVSLKLFCCTPNRKYQNTSLISSFALGRCPLSNIDSLGTVMSVHPKGINVCEIYLDVTDWDWSLNGGIFFSRVKARFTHQVVLATVVYLLVWLTVKTWNHYMRVRDPEISDHQAQPTDNVRLRLFYVKYTHLQREGFCQDRVMFEY